MNFSTSGLYFIKYLWESWACFYTLLKLFVAVVEENYRCTWSCK